MTNTPATIDLNPSGDNPQASIIWLHGLGADANDFVPIAEQFNLLDKYKVRFVFPNAPFRSITVNGGMKMRAWYDISELDLSHSEDLEGIKESTKLIESLIEREIGLGIAYQNIILAGFSQGGAIALYAGLRYPKRLGGIIALSTYMPDANSFGYERSLSNQSIPLFLAHGLFDPIVPLMLGEMCRQQLEGLNYAVEWHSYSMPHTVIPEEIKDIGSFLKKTMSSAFSSV